MLLSDVIHPLRSANDLLFLGDVIHLHSYDEQGFLTVMIISRIVYVPE